MINNTTEVFRGELLEDLNLVYKTEMKAFSEEDRRVEFPRNVFASEVENLTRKKALEITRSIDYARSLFESIGVELDSSVENVNWYYERTKYLISHMGNATRPATKIRDSHDGDITKIYVDTSVSGGGTEWETFIKSSGSVMVVYSEISVIHVKAIDEVEYAVKNLYLFADEDRLAELDKFKFKEYGKIRSNLLRK